MQMFGWPFCGAGTYIRRKPRSGSKTPAKNNSFSAGSRKSRFSGFSQPQASWEKIASGKLEKFYQDACLLEQPFIKDPNLKVADILTQKIATIGENIGVRRFTRYQLGEEE